MALNAPGAEGSVNLDWSVEFTEGLEEAKQGVLWRILALAKCLV